MAKLGRDVYERELLRLQIELVKLQEWVRATGARLVVVFEGRDAAGKGSAIKRITEHLNPRVARIVALPAPSERERTQWYFQRYVAHLPAAGEIVLLDRSWYNRAGVERVMGYSPMDLESLTRWEDYSRAKDEMMVHTDIPEAPWYAVEGDDKRRARINMIAHLLGTIDYHEVTAPEITLPARPPSTGYQRTARALQREVPDHAAKLT
ncbi:hypothetical protein [Nocardia sp. NRRL S-836]|uniref:hypothetical protein n=1 Tax=Nocardia sp. NRRL S-836 TaxID=1519492 RepID=UPI0006AF81E4|nr:hypothetical protein [Nocardia sp. NRRL S-836]KOV90104.1 hypothetical protein ADL03_01860 [Nocardia sp. NRRL S-836]